jgi:hypothetical protein
MTNMTKAFEALPGTEPTTLCDTTGCKWPIGEGKPFYFCNAAVAHLASTPYCTAHLRIGVTPAMAKKRGQGRG